MTRRTITLFVSALLATAATFVCIKLSAAHRTQSATTALAERRAQLERRAHELEQQLAETVRIASERRAAIESAEKLTSTSSVKSKPRPDAATLMAQNPELRELFERYSRSDLGLRYKPFYRAARLTPEQIVRFQALIIEQKQEQLDLESAAQSSDLADADRVKLRTETEQRHSAEQHQLLGDEAFTAYREFQRVEPMQGYVESVACLGIGTAEPLTEAQGERLLEILAKSNSSYQTGGKADGEVNWPQALGQVQAVLSPKQAAVLQGRADLAHVFDLAAQYQTQHEQGGH